MDVRKFFSTRENETRKKSDRYSAAESLRESLGESLRRSLWIMKNDAIPFIVKGMCPACWMRGMWMCVHCVMGPAWQAVRTDKEPLDLDSAATERNSSSASVEATSQTLQLLDGNPRHTIEIRWDVCKWQVIEGGKSGGQGNIFAT